jgi:SH3-like domain-containing protein
VFSGFGHRLAPCLAAFLLAAPLCARAAEKALPRFVSLRADEVNLRTGPGERYPIDWVLTRKGLPVEVVAEYEAWRKIRDHQGDEGWVHERLLTASRTVIVAGSTTRVLHVDPDAASPAAARAEPGLIARLLECPRGGWCRIEAQGSKGWLERSALWGIYPDEVVE